MNEEQEAQIFYSSIQTFQYETFEVRYLFC